MNNCSSPWRDMRLRFMTPKPSLHIWIRTVLKNLAELLDRKLYRFWGLYEFILACVVTNSFHSFQSSHLLYSSLRYLFAHHEYSFEENPENELLPQTGRQSAFQLKPKGNKVTSNVYTESVLYFQCTGHLFQKWSFYIINRSADWSRKNLPKLKMCTFVTIFYLSPFANYLAKRIEQNAIVDILLSSQNVVLCFLLLFLSKYSHYIILICALHEKNG